MATFFCFPGWRGVQGSLAKGTCTLEEESGVKIIETDDLDFRLLFLVID